MGGIRWGGLTTAGSGPRDSAVLAFYASGAGPLLRSVIHDQTMRSLVYPGLSGLTGAACLIAAAILSHIEGNVVTLEDYRLLSALCWFGLAAGLVGAVWALVLRIRSARKEMSTLVIFFCSAVVAASV